MAKAELLRYERTCGYCGARLELSANSRGGPLRLYPYACPQCGKPDDIELPAHPHVRVIAPRTDGRSGMYEETMF